MKPSFDDIDIYPVTGRGLYGGRSDEEVITQLAAGGARVVQLREKGLSDGPLLELARVYRRETEKHGMLLVINDRPDIAMITGADGVHLGQDDLPVGAVRELLGPGAIIGASSHDLDEARRAEAQGATYVNIGPVFPTPTKPGAKTVGPETVREVVGGVTIPVTCMGGIVDGNIDQVLAAGARRIGVITAVFGEDDIERATRGLVDKIKAAYHQAPR